MKLYLLDHCPFCARVRVILGLKDLPFELHYIQQDDSETPTKMTGNDLMPILEYAPQQYMVESLDIVKYLDEEIGESILLPEQDTRIANWINNSDDIFDRLTTPLYYQMDLPELASLEAREAYRAIHEPRVDDFNQLHKEATSLMQEGHNALLKLETILDLDRVKRQTFALDDILLYPMLRHITAIKGIELPSKVAKYIEIMEKASKLPSYQSKAIDPFAPVPR